MTIKKIEVTRDWYRSLGKYKSKISLTTYNKDGSERKTKK